MNRKICIWILLCFLLFASSAAVAKPHRFPHPDTLTYKPLNFNPPSAKRHVLENGIILYILEDNELPLVNITAVFRSGSVHDPIGKAGLAELTHRLMRTGGTILHTGEDIDDRLDFHGISLSFSAEMDMGSARLSALKKDIDLGFEIFSQMLRHPRFAVDKLDLAKSLLIEGLRHIQDNPSQHAFREFRKLLYKDNPRGNLHTTESLRNIERADLLEFHMRHFYPGNVMLAISGDITENDALQLARRHLGDWQSPGRVEAPTAPTGHTLGAIHYLHREIPQSVVICGWLAPSKRDSDYYAFSLLDFILGSGGFRSRIFEEVRSKRGLAYSTGSFYRAGHDYGAFGAYAMTRSAATTKVLSLLMNIINEAQTDKVSSGELAWAKKSIYNNYIFSFASTEQIANQQMMLEYNGLPADFLVTYPTLINKATAEDLLSTARRYFLPEQAVRLVLGDEKAFDSPLPTIGHVIRIKGDL